MKLDAHPFLVFGSQALALLMIMIGVVGQRAALHSERPRLGERGELWDDRKQVFLARLWEDPFRPLVSDQQKSSLRSATAQETQPPVQEFNTNVRRRAAQLEQQVGVGLENITPLEQSNLLLMLSMGGGSNPEAKELRLRSRYAVVSALLSAGYRSVRAGLWPFPLPTESFSPVSHLFKLEFQHLRKLKFDQRAVLEQFERDPLVAAGAAYQNITLLWVNDTIGLVDPDPDMTLISQKTVEEITDAIRAAFAVNPTKIVLFDLGNSDRLRGFYQASKGLNTALKIYSLRASLSETLFKKITKQEELSTAIIRLAQQDDSLVGLIVHELKERLPTLLNRSSGRIVLLTESDTTYSRGLIEEIKQTLKSEGVSADRVDVYTYLRGLDGGLEGDASQSETPAKNKTNTPVAEAIEAAMKGRLPMEGSAGSSQFDYLRRLAIQLGNREQQSRVLAVGVLGSDVYDKLLVLQALRPELPQTVFFTTEMDALYLHADNEEVARNLIVASATELRCDSASEDWQVPPMRDSYQVVLFDAVKRIATGKDPFPPQPTTAKLLEIGAGSAVSLDTSPREEVTAAEGILAKGWVTPLLFLLGTINGLLILLAVITRLHSHQSRGKAGHLHPVGRLWMLAEAALLGIVPALVLSVFFAAHWLRGSPVALWGEPLSWTSGVSVWPTILIRVIAIFTAILLMWIAARTVDAAFCATRFQLKRSFKSDKFFSDFSLLAKLQGFCQRHILLSEPSNPPHVTVRKVLQYIGSRRWRLIRITSFAVIYLVLSSILFWYLPPLAPGRGGWVLRVEKVTLAFGVGLYIVHLLYCLDVHVMALILLRSLRQYFDTAKRDHQLVTVACRILEPAAEYTLAAGRTLLYPLTVLVLIMLSRIHFFDAWRMTPSLWLTMLIGAVVLAGASLLLVSEAVRLRSEVLRIFDDLKEKNAPAKKRIEKLDIGAFSRWYQQPIFAAFLSLVAILATVGFSEPLLRLIIG
jgi:hypothetical protein